MCGSSASLLAMGRLWFATFSLCTYVGSAGANKPDTTNGKLGNIDVLVRDVAARVSVDENDPSLIDLALSVSGNGDDQKSLVALVSGALA